MHSAKFASGWEVLVLPTVADLATGAEGGWLSYPSRLYADAPEQIHARTLPQLCCNYCVVLFKYLPSNDGLTGFWVPVQTGLGRPGCFITWHFTVG